jgi:chromosome segregation ATPase
MDVNEVKDPQGGVDLTEHSASTAPTARQREIQSLSIKKVSVSAEAVQLDVEARGEHGYSSDMRTRINSIISTINVASEATSEINTLVKSIEGIVQQADDAHISDERRGKLEVEANELVKEIQRKAKVPASIGSAGPDSEVRLEIEQKLGRALEALFPDGARDAFGIGSVSFSPKDMIIDVRTSVEVAQRRIDDLSKAIENAKREVKETMSSIEVAAQNSEAADSSIRDVDAALKLASETRTGIGEHPDFALKSVGHIDKSALDLLGS